MYDNIDELIDKNLSKFMVTNGYSIFFDKFRDLENDIMDSLSSNKFARYMEEKGLIIVDGERCDLTKFGIGILQIGWIQYLEKEKVKAQKYQEQQQRNTITQKRKDVQEELIRKETIEKFRYDKIAFWVSIGAVIISLIALLK
jgi:hypothetical protein